MMHGDESPCLIIYKCPGNLFLSSTLTWLFPSYGEPLQFFEVRFLSGLAYAAHQGTSQYSCDGWVSLGCGRSHNFTSTCQGGTGFIGSWVIRLLLDSGYNVRATVRSSSKGDFLSRLFDDCSERFEYVVVPDIKKVKGSMQCSCL